MQYHVTRKCRRHRAARECKRTAVHLYNTVVVGCVLDFQCSGARLDDRRLGCAVSTGQATDCKFLGLRDIDGHFNASRRSRDVSVYAQPSNTGVTVASACRT